MLCCPVALLACSCAFHLTFQPRFVGERGESELCVFKSQIEFTLDSEWPLTRLKRSLQGVNLTPSQLFDEANF